MKTIVISSSNKNKINQIKKMSCSLGVDAEFKSPADFGITDEPLENGRTYKENALIKAKHIFFKLGLPSLADDSGFELEALNGFPGLVSSRFAKACESYEQAFKIINDCLGENKNSSFFTGLAFVYKKDNKVIEKTFDGKISGEFVYPPRGTHGFGYCPCFKPYGYEQTFGEMPDDLRMSINHRFVALNKFFDFLKNLYL